MFVKFADGALANVLADTRKRICIEECLLMHQRRSHVLAMQPRDIQMIRAADFVGPLASIVLDAIEQRYLEYAAAARAVPRRLLLDFSPTVEKFAYDGGDIRVNTEWYTSEYREYPPVLFVESVTSDRLAVEFIVRAHAHLNRWPDQLVKIRPRHGGGSTLGALLNGLDRGEAHGFCLADRDCHLEVPPYRAGSTAAAANSAAARAGWIANNERGYSSRVPAFAFDVTAGWSIENYIGPHVLSVYFDVNPGAAATHRAFVRAFSSFPNLTEHQALIWMMIYFKDPASCGVTLEAELSVRAGHVSDLPTVNDNLKQLVMPANVIDWCASNIVAGRYRNRINVAFAADYGLIPYREACDNLVLYIRELLAGDQRMARI